MARYEIRSAPQFHIFSSKMARFEIRSAPQFHEFSSEIVSFQIRSAPQFHQFSSKIAHFQIRNFVRNGQISNKERGVPGRVVSPIRFFDPILNNALALRASQKFGLKNQIFFCENSATFLELLQHLQNLPNFKGNLGDFEECCNTRTLLAKIGADTAENERNVAEDLPKSGNG